MEEKGKFNGLGRLVSEHWWSFLDGYQKYHYVVWVTPNDVWKYKEIDEDGNTIGTPSPEDIEYDIFK